MNARTKPKGFWARTHYLSQKENWTPLMRFVWREALLFGLVLGMLLGLILGLWLG
jgi:hypothetical protein